MHLNTSLPIYTMRSTTTRKINILNKNIVKEIFSFLPLEHLLNSIAATSKANKSIINDFPNVSYVKNNFDYLINHITFLEEDLCPIKNKIKSMLETNATTNLLTNSNDICLYLLLKKYSKSSLLNLSPNCRQDSDPKDFNLLSKFLSNKKIKLKELNLYDNNIGENQQSLNLLADGISKNTTIDNLILGKNALGNPTLNLALFANALAKNNTIRIIRFDENSFVDNQLGIQSFFEQLINNESIVSLYLENNKLGKNKESMFHISEFLKRNLTLKSLDLSLNNLGINPCNLLYLTNALETNKSLESLDLNSNEIGKYNESRESNGKLLTSLLIDNSNLKQLNLSNNDFKPDDIIIDRIHEAVKINKTTREIYLYSNAFGAEQKNLIHLINLEYPFINIKI